MPRLHGLVAILLAYTLVQVLCCTVRNLFSWVLLAFRDLDLSKSLTVFIWLHNYQPTAISAFHEQAPCMTKRLLNIMLIQNTIHCYLETGLLLVKHFFELLFSTPMYNGLHAQSSIVLTTKYRMRPVFGCAWWNKSKNIEDGTKLQTTFNTITNMTEISK